MVAPVIIDDGGSTRVRLLGDKKDQLIEVDEANNESTGLLDGNYKYVKVLSVDETGALISPPADFPTALGDDDKLVVWSGNNHRVIVKIAGGKLGITLKGVNNNDPAVHARHVNKQRHYIVNNAPAIDKVTLNPKGTQPEKTFKPANAIYTAVILSE